MATEQKSISIRFPVDLYAQVKQAAEVDRRSFNAEVLALVEAGLAARKDAARP